jgi:NADH-quinone oxidoreductase subunit L
MNAQFPLYLIPLLPLLGAAFLLLFGRRLSRQTVHLVAVGAVLAAATVAIVAVMGDLWSLRAAWIKQGAPPGLVPKLVSSSWTWIASGDLRVPVGFMLDPLSAVMVLVVTGVGSLIHIYSCGYMAKDPDYPRFFAYLNLFTGAMLILVLADSLVLTFVGWEGVGLCSYLLIGFWYDKEANASAGKKAFIVNRIGDLGFILGMLLLWATVGTLDYSDLTSDGLRNALLEKKWQFFAQGTDYTSGKLEYWLELKPSLLIGVALFVGAAGKSAQFPLYVWLPDAMAGPTPVSALIHAATMVTAGVYLIARLSFLYTLSPVAMTIVAGFGAFTALFAATIAFAQNDIKKVLAYSTVSQLGFMFAAVGVGAFGAGIFHLATHAFFKACLFLGAGAVIHALHNQQDIREMGGLRRRLPATHWTFLVSCIAIAGLPAMSGFFSKDAIILASLVNVFDKAPGTTMIQDSAAVWISRGLYVTLTAASLCTAFYMFRLYALVFLGESRSDAHTLETLHAPSASMDWPLILLAGGATLVGLLGVPTLLTGTGGVYLLLLTTVTALVLVWLAFFGSQVLPTPGEERPRVPWLTVHVPLFTLAAALVLLGAMALPGVGKLPADWLAQWLAPSFSGKDVIQVAAAFAQKTATGVHPYHVGHGAEVALMAIAVIVALVGVGAALAIYHRGPSAGMGSLVHALGWFYRLVLDKWRIDELFALVVVRPLAWFAYVLRKAVDEFLIDKVLVTGVSYVVYGIGWIGSQLQTGRARQYLAAMLVGLGALLFLATRPVSTFRVRTVGAQVTVVAGQPGDRILGPSSLQIEWDFDGDGKPDRQGQRARWRYPRPGSYTVKMTATDPRFGTTSTRTEKVEIGKGKVTR